MAGRLGSPPVRPDPLCRARQSLLAKEDMKLATEITEDISTYMQELCKSTPNSASLTPRAYARLPAQGLQAEVIIQLWQFAELRRSSLNIDLAKDDRNPSEWLSPSKLQALEHAFLTLEAEQAEGVDMSNFVRLWHEHVSDRISTKDLEKLFMKIDCERTKVVTWSDYISYTVVETLKQDYMRTTERPKPYPKELRRVLGQRDRDLIMRIEFVPASSIAAVVSASAPPAGAGSGAAGVDAAAAVRGGRYITVSRDGNLNYWSAGFKRLRTINIAELEQMSRYTGYVYVSDMVHMSGAGALALAFVNDRTIRIYSTAGGKFERACVLSHLTHVPLCLEYVPDAESSEHCSLLYGDTEGNVTVLRLAQCAAAAAGGVAGSGGGAGGPLSLKLGDGKEVHLLDAIAGLRAPFVGGHVFERLHDDWVVRIKRFRSLGRDMFVSCSRSSERTLYVGSVDRRGARYFSVRRGVLCFDYCHAASTIAAGCSDGTVRILNPYAASSRAGIMLSGHRKPVSHVAIDDKREFVVTIATDKTVIVFCLKENVPIQCIDARRINLGTWPITSIYMNALNDSLVIATNYIGLLEQPQRARGVSRGGASSAEQEHLIVGCLYNKLFQAIVAADTSSTVYVWSIVDGAKAISFHNAHTTVVDDEVRPVEISCIAFDSSLRRLITGAIDGSVHLWNFNNGALLRRVCDAGSAEVTGLSCVAHKDLIYVATGSDRQVTCFVDHVDPKHRHVRRYARGHRSEILCLASDRSCVATGALDGEILIWSLASEHPILRLNASVGTEPYLLRKYSGGGGGGARTSGAVYDFVERAGPRAGGGSFGGRLGSASSPPSSLPRCSRVILDPGAWSPCRGDDESPAFSPEPSTMVATGTTSDQLKEQLTFGQLVTDRLSKLRHSGGPKRTEGGSVRFEAGAIHDYRNPPDTSADQVSDMPRGDATSVDLLLFLEARVASPRTATLLASGAEGWIRAWSVVQEGGLIGQFNACHCLFEATVQMATDGKNEFLITGDTMGYIKVWDLAEYCLERSQLPRRDTSYAVAEQLKRSKFIYLSDEQCDGSRCSFGGRESLVSQPLMTVFSATRRQPPAPKDTTDPGRTLRYPKLLNSFRGHVKAVTCIAINDELMLIVTASSDQTIRLWTVYGSFVGQFGSGPKWSLVDELAGSVAPPPSDVIRVASYTTLKVLKRGKYPRWQLAKKVCLENAVASAFAKYRKRKVEETGGSQRPAGENLGEASPSGAGESTAARRPSSTAARRPSSTAEQKPKLLGECAPPTGGRVAKAAAAGGRGSAAQGSSTAVGSPGPSPSLSTPLSDAASMPSPAIRPQRSVGALSGDRGSACRSDARKGIAPSNDTARRSRGKMSDGKEQPIETKGLLPPIKRPAAFGSRSYAKTSSIFRVGSGTQKRRGSLPVKLPELRHAGTHIAVYHALTYSELLPVPKYSIPSVVRELLMSGSYVTTSRRSSLRSKSTHGVKSCKDSMDDARLISSGSPSLTQLDDADAASEHADENG